MKYCPSNYHHSQKPPVYPTVGLDSYHSADTRPGEAGHATGDIHQGYSKSANCSIKGFEWTAKMVSDLYKTSDWNEMRSDRTELRAASRGCQYRSRGRLSPSSHRAPYR
ncbi:hypothetical protein B5807_06699 [Epicoccum nigrum]|uniref:Uncharacterized protein n=1 Tax=Epicoccum nigrum TaxID=105696 RepID=A0A1Y2LVU5_EPING|nr:hypothetical protein B5807_06699 [Epicoccum nigrum]